MEPETDFAHYNSLFPRKTRFARCTRKTKRVVHLILATFGDDDKPSSTEPHTVWTPIAVLQWEEPPPSASEHLLASALALAISTALFLLARVFSPSLLNLCTPVVATYQSLRAALATEAPVTALFTSPFLLSFLHLALVFHATMLLIALLAAASLHALTALGLALTHLETRRTARAQKEADLCAQAAHWAQEAAEWEKRFARRKAEAEQGEEERASEKKNEMVALGHCRRDSGYASGCED
ncbi:uncharacterized protein JCM10292_004844 [Rhodotorula paludigena]|uniref:uncharacterized protein n=1 Tax=Rhodotorula paludigena TaxID=86838 RepID=UPI00317122C5